MTYMSEIKGLTHWLIYSEGNEVFAWDIVRDNKIQKLVDGLTECVDIAVDANQSYLFVVDQQSPTNSVVSRYTYNITDPGSM